MATGCIPRQAGPICSPSIAAPAIWRRAWAPISSPPSRSRRGQPPEKGLLVNRDDLTADYVKAVVRNGKGAMPRQTKVDITDAELDKVAAFLGKGK